MTNSNKQNLFANKIILAPMVRQNSLSFRLLCLHFGADLVYTEELIDYRVSACRRLENKPLGTIDFVDDRGEILFRTCEEEKEKVVLQLGSNNPQRALRAAKLVSKDVVGVDFNFGCPKAFSLSGGMGAALLEKPEQIKALLTTCVENLDIPVTCKIRLLPDRGATLKLVKMIESCGVSAIGIHGRTKDQRPHHENNNELLREIAESISIPMIANGGSNKIKSYEDIIEFKKNTRAPSVMIARASMKNPSIFKSDNLLVPIGEVIPEFLKLAVRFDNCVANTKYATQAMMAGGVFGGDFVHKFHGAYDLKTICDLFGLSNWFESNKNVAKKTEFYGGYFHNSELELFITKREQELKLKGMDLICDNTPYVAKVYGKIAPKSQLMSYVDKDPSINRPQFEVFMIGKHCFHCIIIYQGKCYLNKTYSSSKKGSEHATAMILCEKLGTVELNDYKSRTNGNNKKVN